MSKGPPERKSPPPPGFVTDVELTPTPKAERAYWDDQEKLWYRIDVKGTDSPLPRMVDAASFAGAEMVEPTQIVSGVLHQGCKLALGGGSKTFKTWTLLDLALSVAHGERWLGFGTNPAKVCYLNFELAEWAFQRRLHSVAAAKELEIDAGQLSIWNLRGHATAYDKILPMLGAEIKGSGFGLLILDPIYRIYGDADENSARDISALLTQFERLAQSTGAAVAFASHFSKGNQASKESIDRISGSGVFARDPDAILTFTRHEQDGAFTVDSTLRNCPQVEPFVVRWSHPLMVRDGQLDPAKLKQPNRGGRTSTYTVQMILECLGQKKMKTAHWQKACAKESAITRPTFYRLFEEAQRAKLVERDSKDRWSVSEVSGVSKLDSETSDTRKSHNL